MEYKSISVENKTAIAKGQCGNIYQLSDDKIVKVYNSFVPIEEIEKEQKNASLIHKMGLPSAQVFDIVETEEGKGLVYEFIKADSLQNLLKADPSKMEEYAKQLGELGRKMHSIDVSGHGFKPASDEFLERLESAKGLIIELYDAETYEKIKSIITSIPQATSIIHGDFHPENVLVKDEKYYLIDLADVMVGNSIFDLFSLYFLRIKKRKCS